MGNLLFLLLERMIMERSFKGIWIPSEIWLSKELNIQEKVFLAEIESLDKEMGCYASNLYFSEFFGLSKNRCSEVLKSLEYKGFITIKYLRKKGGKSIEKRIIKVSNMHSESRQTYSESRQTYSESRQTYSESRQTYSENSEENNIVNNIDYKIDNNIYCPNESDSEKKIELVSVNPEPIDSGKMKIPPSLEDVENYCMERNNTIDAEAFIDFYTSKGWLVGKAKMKDWKAAMRTWERKSRESKNVSQNKKSFMDELESL